MSLYGFQYEYPAERTPQNLIPVPYGYKVSVEIVREDDSAYVWVHAPMYKNKLFRMDHSYDSKDFPSDHNIIHDGNFITAMLRHFPKNY